MRPEAVFTAPGTAAADSRKPADFSFSPAASAAAFFWARAESSAPYCWMSYCGFSPASEARKPFFRVSISAGLRLSGLACCATCCPTAAPKARIAFSSSVIVAPGAAEGDPEGAAAAGAASFFWHPPANTAAPRRRA